MTSWRGSGWSRWIPFRAPSTGPAPAATTCGPNVVECDLCGTRLRPDHASDALEVGPALLTVARHRCVPRITLRSR